MWHSETHGTFNRARSFTHDNRKYGASAFRFPELLEYLKIYPMRVEKINSKLYTQGAESKGLVDGTWVVSYEAIEKTVEELKKQLVIETMQWHDSLLSNTDKIITREEEIDAYMVNRALNPALKLWRGQIYVATEERLLAIESASTFEEIAELSETPMVEMPEVPVALIED